jgi:hypothetical protein
MTSLPPVLSSDQQARDTEHLNLLSIFYFILAGLGAIGVGFAGVHFAFMRAIFTRPDLWKNQKNGPPPSFVTDLILWLFAFALAMIVIVTVLNLLAGIFIRQRRHRMFSLVVGALNCLQVPFGTALGVFTIIVLTRDSVRRLYESRRL